MNPFTERGRITDPNRFTGRWREVGMVFERLERRQPVMLTGAAGSGKSSLLTHVAQSAGAVLELPDLNALFLDLGVLPDAATVYRLIVRELGGRGENADETETALVHFGHPVLIALDQADHALAAGWGEALLERMARIARRSIPLRDDDGRLPPGTHHLMLVVAAGDQAPVLSEPFAQVRLGALAPAEVRLLTEAYLGENEAPFSSDELLTLGQLSAGHPAYLQRAAYHLYETRLQPTYDWRRAYLAEARERPIPGAPLPPEVFEGEAATNRDEARLGELAPGDASTVQPPGPALEIRPFIEGMLPLLVALIALQLSANWVIALVVLVAGYTLVALLRRR